MSRAPLLALILTLAITAAVVLAASRVPFGRGSGPVTSETYAQPLRGARELDVDLSMGAGTLRVETIDSENAYEAAVTHNAGVRVSVTYADGRLRISDRGFRFTGGRVTNEWTVRLTRKVPVKLEASTGAGHGTFDLTGLSGSADIRAGAGEVRVEFRENSGQLEELELRAGAGRFEVVGLGYARVRRVEARAGIGEFTLDFSGAEEGTTELDVRSGVGRVVLVIPEGVGVRIRVRRSPTSRLNLHGFTQVDEDEFTNAAWESARARVEIRARLGVGEFAVRGR